jgi:hypothetical protein
MFKHLALVVMFAVSFSAHAENWFVVTDSKTGERLLADLESIKVDNYTTSTGGTSVRMSSTMTFVGEGDSDPFTAIIDVKECFSRKRGILVNVYKDQSHKTYFWDENGSKMYDAQGQFLCGFAIGMREEAQKSKKQPNTQSF